METEMLDVDKVKENRVRRLARRHGYAVRKSRRWEHVPNIDNHGEFMMLDGRNLIVLCSRFDATLDHIEAYFQDDRGDN